MVNPAGSVKPSRSILEGLANRRFGSKQKTFEQQLEKLLNRSERALEEQRPAVATANRVPNRQALAGLEQHRQDVGTKANPFAGAGPGSSRAEIATAENRVAPADPLTVLREAMQKAGVPSGVELTISDEIVYYPGGSYRNYLVRADFGNGNTESYSLDLMLKSPWVTATEMKRLMGGTVA